MPFRGSAHIGLYTIILLLFVLSCHKNAGSENNLSNKSFSSLQDSINTINLSIRHYTE